MRRNTLKPVRQSRGFTLIEILVVVTVIAIIVSLAMLNLSILRDDREIRREARRVAALVQVAQDEALLQGREYGIEFLQTAYRFVEFDPYELRWMEMLDDAQYRTRTLPEGMEFELLLEDQVVILNLDAIDLSTDEDDDENSPVSRDQTPGRTDGFQPHVLLYSSGDMTPFELRVVDRANDFEVALTADPTGTIELDSDANE